jgi:putative hydrolases of HD superfamily
MVEYELDFLFKLQKLKHIKRQNIVQARPESVAEHTCGLAILAMIFHKEYPFINLEQALKMALIHDFGELEIGDVSIYDISDEKERQNIERKHIKKILQDYPVLYSLWEEFESNKTPEARYIQSLDQLEAVIHNITEDGKSWKKYNRTKDIVRNYKLLHVSSEFHHLLEQLMYVAEQRSCFALENNVSHLNKKLFCVVGVHSSGKTTLINRLIKESSIQLTDRIVLEIQTDDPFRRAMIRLLKYYFECLDNVRVQHCHPEITFISDRCVYDTLAYVDGYFNLGWISQEQKETIINMYSFLFTSELLPKNIIFLAPPLDWVKAKLKERSRMVNGWREDNFEYLEAVVKSYNHIFSNNPYKLDIKVNKITETKLHKRVQKVKKVLTDFRY